MSRPPKIMISHTASLSRLRRFFQPFLLTICFVACAPFVQAQDLESPAHPIFSRPIQEAEPLPWDIRSLRAHIFIEPESHVIRGEAEIDVIMDAREFDSSLVLLDRFRDVEISITDFQPDSLFASGAEPQDEFSATPQDSFPDDRPDSTSRLLVRVEYAIERALNTFPLGTSSGDWMSVWTSFEPGNSEWIPFQIGLNDWFSAELRVSAPQDWEILIAGNQAWNIEDTDFRTVSSSHPVEIPISGLGFAAFEASTISPRDDHVVVSGVDEDAMSLNEGLISMIRMESFYRTQIGDPEPDSSAIVIFPGPRQASTSGSGLTFIPVTALPSGLVPAEEDFRLAKAMALRWIVRKMPLAGWTDVWIHEALASYMAALYVRDRHGEAAYQHVLWNRRDEYLSEASIYQRPLVWDRWEHPSELIDAHSSGKGLWIFHMLGETHGSEFIWSALDSLAAAGRSGPITTEELRQALDESLELDLADYFDQWVYAAGHPVLDYTYSVSSDQESVDLTITQSQEGYLIPNEYAFELTVESASLVGLDSDEFFVDERTSSISLPVALRPQYVLLDPLGRLLFENGSTLDPNTIVSSLRRNESLVARYVGSRRLTTSDVDASMMIALRPILSAQHSPYVDHNLLDAVSRMAPSSSALRSILEVARDSTARSRHHAVEKLGEFPGATDARRVAFDVANTESDPMMLAAAVSALVRLDSTLAWPVLRSALVTESTGEIVRRRAVSILPGAPVAAEEKMDALLALLDDKYQDILRIDVLIALQAWPDEAQIIDRISSMWDSASGELRASLLDYLTLVPRSLDDNAAITEWLSREPDPVLYQRLKAAFPEIQE